MITKSHIILGLFCVVVLSVSITGMMFFEDSFFGFMDSTPSENQIKRDSKILSEINQLGLEYENDNDSEKFNEQVLLMQEKQKEVASNILEIKLSKVCVDSPFNFPFKDLTHVKIIELEKQFAICDIPENIPLHLQTIRDSEMFRMFSEKYSHHPLMLEISDERNFESTVHYTLSATSENEKDYASTYFHINSCTGESAKGYTNLHCRNENTDDFTHAFLFENIVTSLKDDSFCTISFMPWQEKLFEYSGNISNKMQKMNQEMMNQDMPLKDMEEAVSRDSDMGQASLLSQITFEATRNLDNDFLKNSELVIEYREKFGDLPKKLQELIEQRPSIIEQ